MESAQTVSHETVFVIGPTMLVGDDKFVPKYSTIGK